MRAMREDMRAMREETRDEMRATRQELSTAIFGLQRQLAHIGWGLAFALIGAVAAVIVSAAL